MDQPCNKYDVIFYSTFFYCPLKIRSQHNFDLKMPLKTEGLGYWKEIPYFLWKSIGTETELGKYSLHNQELLYFHHYMSRIGYNLCDRSEKDKFLKYYRLYKDDKEINFDDKKYFIVVDDVEKGFYLSDLALYIFKDSKIGILTIGVKNDGCMLKDAMEFNMNFRLLFITDNEQLDDGKGRIFRKISIKNLPLRNEFSYEKHFVIGKDYLPENINAIVENLLPYNKKEYNLILDQRMMLHTLICLDEALRTDYGYDGNDYNKAERRKKYHQLFSRILFAIECKKGYPYDESFMPELIKKYIYTKWQHEGTLYGFCRYADATMVFGKDDDTKKLIMNNFHIYYMMSIIALYYRCALIDFADQSSDVTKVLITPRKWMKYKKVNKLRKDFIMFSNVWYFRELTNQDQGIEMFDMHRRAYEIDELYNQVKEEIEKLDEYIRMERAKWLNRLVLILTLGALLTGFFGMNFEFDWFKKLIGRL